MSDHRIDPPMVVLSPVPRGSRPRAAEDVGSRYSLRPRTAPQLLDLGVEVLARRLLICIGVCVALWLPARALMPAFFEMIGRQGSASQEWAWLGFFGGIMVIQGLIEILATTAVTLLSYEELLGGDIGLREMTWRTFRRLPALILLFILVSIPLWFAAACPPLFFAYLFFRWKLSVAPSVLVLENLRLGAAIKRSFTLTRRSFLRFFGVLVLVWILVFGFTGGSQVGDMAMIQEGLFVEMRMPSEVTVVLLVIVTSLFAGIVTAVNAVAITAYYLDTRIRREGLDLEMRLERMRSASSAQQEAAR